MSNSTVTGSSILILTDPQLAILFSLNLLELAVHVFLAFPTSIINFWFIFRTSILHPNLKFILLCQSNAIFVRAVGRVLSISRKIALDDMTWPGTLTDSYIYGFSSYFRNSQAHALVIERLMATFLVKKYENSRKPYFSAIWFSVAVVYSIANLFTARIPVAVAFNMFSWVFYLALGIFEIIIFAWILRRNDRIFNNKIAPLEKLSERYQLAENIRTAKQLIPTFLLHFFNIFLGTVTNGAIVFRVFGTQLFLYHLSSQLFYSAVAVINVLIELTIILNHPYLKRNLLSIWRLSTDIILCRQNRHQIKPAFDVFSNQQRKKSVRLTNIRGEQLPLEDDAKEHFKQLRLSWENTAIK